MKKNLLICTIGTAFIGCAVLSHAQTNLSTLVVPRVNEALDGSATDGGGSTLFQERLRLQAVYESSLFPSNKVLIIRELRYRPTAVGGRAFTATVSNLQINLSTTRSNANGLSATFASNAGADNVVGFQGTITLSSAFTGPTGGPKDFDIKIPLTTPFRYNPANGNLLIDVRNSSGSSASWIDAGGRIDDGASRAISLDPNGATAVTRDKAAEVVQLVYTEDPRDPIVPTFDVARDFSIDANPNGAWSYGAERSLGRAFELLPTARHLTAGNGVELLSWSVDPITSPAVYYNATSQTASNGTTGVFPPGTFMLEVGWNSTPQSFGVTRLTVPAGAGGTYRLESTVHPHLNGPGWTPGHFYIFRNSASLFDRLILPDTSAGYSNLVGLAAGDTVDFVIGRGPSDQPTALKLQARLVQVSTNQPPPPPPTSFDVARDFSINANPNGVWSYGAERSLGGTFELLPTARHLSAGNGVEILSWALGPTTAPAVYYNATSQTATSDGGAGVYPPGTLWFEVGWNSTPQSFGVNRFTVPAGAGGTYRLESTVHSSLNGPGWTPCHFYILRNSASLFDRLVLADSSASYSNLVGLVAGDTVDFVIGRGPSDQPSALKLEARLVQVSTNVPPPPPPEPTFDVARDFSINANPNGAWSYGSKNTLLGSFDLLTVPRHLDANGVEVLSWAVGPATSPAVYYNGTSQTVTTDGGAGVFPPGTFWFEVGWNSTPQSFGVTRFTVPPGASGTYRLESTVRPHLNGSGWTPGHFYIFRNSSPLFDRLVLPDSSASYSNLVGLASGETVDFVIGRGPSDQPTAMKLQARLVQVSTNVIPPPPPPYFVVPVGLDVREGNGGSASLGEPLRLQEVYRAADFPSAVIRITELRFRPSVDSGTGAFSNVIPNIVLKLSTTARQPDNLSTTFAQNIGADQTTVYSGALPIQSRFTGPAGGPKDFDIVVHLQQPFVYNPAAGNLLFDIQNISGAPVRYVVDAEGSQDGVSRVISLNPNSATASAADTGGDVLAIVYDLVPPPPPPMFVVPAGLESREGNGGSSSLSEPLRLQEVYRAADFPANVIRITELRLRPSVDFGTGAFADVVSNIVLKLSTTQKQPDSLSTTFAQNIGSDETVVYSGALPIRSQFTGPAGGPKDFDIVIHLQHPFVYDPSAGNLLLDIQNFSGAPVRYVVDAEGSADGASRVISLDPNAATAVTADTGADVLAIVYQVLAQARPGIISQPQSRTVYAGSTVVFSVIASGSQPFTYQWRRNGSPISGANGPALTIEDAQSANAGTYSVVVSNSVGSITSADATLTILTAPALIVPAGLATREGNGGSSSLSEPLRLQEVYRAADFPGNVIRIREFRFRPSVDFGTGAFSNVVPNIVLKLSTTTRQPDNLSRTFAQNIGADETVVYSGALPIQTQFSGPASGPKDFDIVVRFQRPFIYNPAAGNLLFDIQNFSGAPVRYVVDAEGSQDGTSRVISLDPSSSTAITADSGGDVLAISYEVVSEVAPTITSQPQSRTVLAGSTVIFSVGASGSQPLTYQWRRNGTPIPGANAATLTLNNVQQSDAGAYSVVVANNVSSVTSANATLAVIEGATLVVPSGLETREGNGGSASLSEQLRLQEVYGASQFPAGNLAISEIRLRPSVDAGTGPFSTTISNIQINLSTTQKQPDNLSVVFAENVGSNDTVVFSGPLSISTAFSGPAQGPKDFDIVVPLQTPFIYNPARGNLLVDIRNFSGLPVRYVVDAEGSADQASRVIATSATAAQAVTADSGADVLQIIYTVTNSPPVAKAIISPTVDLSPKIPELLVIAVNGGSAAVSLNGSQSTDPDGDSLTYSWFANGDTTPFATGANAAALLEPGSHNITLVVSDGRTTASNTVEVEVVTLPQMIDILVFLVDDSAVPRKAKRPLIMALKQAGDAIEGDRTNVAIKKLEQFQDKVAAQIGPIDPQTAGALIEAVEKVIEALRASTASP